MIYDRPYMKDGFSERGGPRLLYWILGSCVGIFVLQQFVGIAIGDRIPQYSDQFIVVGRFTNDWFALIGSNLKDYKIWTLLTYGLFHGSLMHLCFNTFVIFIVGRLLESAIGQKNTLLLFLFCVFTGGATWVMLHFGGKNPLIGASAGAAGMIILFAMLNPEEHVDLLLFFVYPVRMKRKWLASILLAMDGVLFLLSELPPLIDAASITKTNIAYSAHLGGMLGGFLFAKWLNRTQTPTPQTNKSWGDIAIEHPQWAQKKQVAAATQKSNFRINITNKKAIKAEVDRILDKINTDGFGALNEEEKKTLDKYGQQLRH